MKQKIFITLLAVAFIFCIPACEKTTEPEDTIIENEVEAGLKEVDQLVGTITQSKVMNAFLFMPDFPIYIPVTDFMEIGFPEEGTAVGSFNKVQDSSFFDFFNSLDSLFGTYTYDGENWFYNSGPQDAIVFVYPYISLSDGQQHTAEVKFYNFVVSNSLISMSMEISVDGQKQFEVVFNLNGSNFLNPGATPLLNSVSITGLIVAADDAEVPFLINITNTEAVINLGDGTIVIGITGTNLLPSNLDGDNSEEAQVTEIKITYGDLLIVINEFEQTSGDMGDVLYAGNKAGDFIIKDDEQPYIKFNSGKEVSVAGLMPNFALLEILLEE